MSRKRAQPAPDNVCFCAQQCAEKYLKAFLVRHRIPFPKTHLLEDLLDLALSIDRTLDALRSDFRVLQPYAVQVRYPGYEATVPESKQAVAVLVRVRKAMRKALGLS
ncbi:MAG TPA: DNA-binding protein [Planctomycetes bacterium]|nr:DNA-binding protein [Planctomycetota bacterium]